MEPIIVDIDRNTLFSGILTTDYMKTEWKEIIDKIINVNIRERMGGNKGIHKPNDVEIFGNGHSLRSA
jgi:hypothetical protein